MEATDLSGGGVLAAGFVGADDVSVVDVVVDDNVVFVADGLGAVDDSVVCVLTPGGLEAVDVNVISVEASDVFGVMDP